MNVLVNGIGNIGTTLANLLISMKDILSLETIHINKNIPSKWLENDLALLERQGAMICSSSGSGKYPRLSEIINEIDYIFDCTDGKISLDNRTRYTALSGLKGACAQGSANGFGCSFMSGLNVEKISGEKFVKIVSCNTHATVSILRTICGNSLENLDHADMVVVRRSEDIGNHKRLVSANVVARHLDPVIGTHHGRDAVGLFKENGIDACLTTSDITTPSQMMHSARFNISLKQELKPAEIHNLIQSNPFISTTDKFDSNTIFELGRRYGVQGRIYSHAIVVSNNLLLNGKNVKGWMFIPQEGNTLLSTIEAYLLQTMNPDYTEIFKDIQQDLIKPVW
ncbi:hypothetical protein KAU08_00980 [bacterium]|nr:hypothetical protein [bacterium]